jgi:hypothetical protein
VKFTDGNCIWNSILEGTWDECGVSRRAPEFHHLRESVLCFFGSQVHIRLLGESPSWGAVDKLNTGPSDWGRTNRC